jgi:ADP-L-glycero-D-manno-heptose 6-epimerase
MRDFVLVDDVVAVNLWFFDHPEKSGIFNLGTGRAQPFNDVAHAVVSSLKGVSGADAAEVAASVEYTPFPDALRGKYQSYTQADMAALRVAGCGHVFADVQTGVGRYMAWLSGRTTS